MAKVMQWTFIWSMTSILLLLVSLTARISAQEDDGISEEQFLELLPSDVPVTMMDRLNSARATRVIEPVELVTSLGNVIGLREPTLSPHHNNNTHMHAFRGIPFAEPPVGERRFAKPIDLMGRWSGGRLNATSYRSFCPQYDVETQTVLGAESCLFLNVYTPAHLGTSDRSQNKLLPVFVFIHGGGYLRGSSSAHGADKLLSRDIVVVTFNYRLGALGFLSTGDSTAPGNYGMLDQVSALKWVQRNIAEFGGDPKMVTIGGFSAGSSSVHLHMYSPLSKNLFHRGIMMSGSAQCFWNIRRNPLTPARMLAEKLKCPSETHQAMVTCLSSKTVNQIVTAQAAIHKFEFNPVWFAPVIDGGLCSNPFLPAPLEDLVQRPVPVIVGTLPNEGLLFAAGVILLSSQPSNVTAVYEEGSRTMFTPWPFPETEKAMIDLAQTFYFTEYAKTSKPVLLEQFSEAITDYCFTSCIWDAAASLAESGVPVYTYLMTHRESATPTWASPLYKKLKALGYDSPLLQRGLSHGDDLVKLFAFPYAIGQGTERDQRFEAMLLHMFVNFISKGTPQHDLATYSLEDIPKWKPVTPGQPVSYYEMSVTPSMVYKPFKVKERNFWRSIVPRPESTTLARTTESESETEDPLPAIDQVSIQYQPPVSDYTCDSDSLLGS